MTAPRPRPPAQPAPPQQHPDPVLPLFLDVLRRHGHITFVLADNLGDHCGRAYFDQAVILLAAENNDCEMRATIAHELFHLECDTCPDDEVEAMTAELLVPLHDALAGKATGNLDAVAARHGVDKQLVKARLRGINTVGG